MSGQIGIALNEVLSMLPGTRVLAGAAGLNRLVRSVGVMETADLFPLIKHGDLILTGLYALKDDPKAQEALVPELHRRGAAGLAVKRRYVADLPPGMLAQADRVAFPLLELSPDVAYSDVMQPIFGQLQGCQAQALARRHQVQQVALQALLEGRGLPRLAATLADLVGNPVVIRDVTGQVLAAADGPGPGGLALDQLSRARAPAGEYRIPGFGEVLVWETGRPLGETDLATIDAVGAMIALELVKERSLLEVERRYRSEFFGALLAPQIESEEILLQRARTFGWELGSRPYFAVALEVAEHESPVPRCPQEIQSARDQYLEALARAALPGMVGQAEGYTVVLLPPPGEKQQGLSRAQSLLALAEPFRKVLRVTAGAGRPYTGVAGIRKSFGEARRAVSVGEKVWGSGGAYHYENLGVYQILSMIEPTDEVEQFFAAIDKLLDYENESRMELVQTLETYFACKGNVRKVSEKLYAHYNTVLYRLERIQQITGVQLEDPAGRLHLQVALQMARLYGRLPAAKAGERNVVGFDRG